MSHGGPAEHITPYDRIALDEPTMIALLSSPMRHEGLVDYFGAPLHAQLVKLARAPQRPAPGRRPRVYVLPGIMGSQLGFVRGGQKPNDVLWLDPIDFNFGRLRELGLPGHPALRPLGAMSYTYLKLTLSLRQAGFDTILVDYDWRHDIATLGRGLAQRIAADGADAVALVGHSMGGLVARAAMTHEVGARVSRLVMLGTPNHGSLAAVQALRGTYSVVRKLAMLDLKHEAEFLAREVFSTFPGLHELLPCGDRAGPLDLFDPVTWPAGPGPNSRLLGQARNLAARLAPADERFHVVVGCNRITATRVALRNGDFVYEYTRRGDGTVPMALARMDSADNRYVDCGHSDMPLSDRVIAGTIDLLRSGGKSRRFAAQPRIRDASRTWVRDTELRREYQGKVDWPQMTPAERREFLDTLNEPPRRMRAPARRAPSPAIRKRKRKGTGKRKSKGKRGRKPQRAR
jgi:pimeloyl-ACP methyl ester carboxylesterase